MAISADFLVATDKASTICARRVATMNSMANWVVVQIACRNARLIDTDDGQLVVGEFAVEQLVEMLATAIANDPAAIETVGQALLGNSDFLDILSMGLKVEQAFGSDDPEGDADRTP